MIDLSIDFAFFLHNYGYCRQLSAKSLTAVDEVADTVGNTEKIAFQKQFITLRFSYSEAI